MKTRRYAGGGGVPTSGGDYSTPAPQYPFPSAGGDVGPTSNMNVTVGGKETEVEKTQNPFMAPRADDGQGQSQDAKPMRKGGKVKTKSRGDGIAQRGKTRGRFV
jgi:hypothetical protein